MFYVRGILSVPQCWAEIADILRQLGAVVVPCGESRQIPRFHCTVSQELFFQLLRPIRGYGAALFFALRRYRGRIGEKRRPTFVGVSGSFDLPEGMLDRVEAYVKQVAILIEDAYREDPQTSECRVCIHWSFGRANADAA